MAILKEQDLLEAIKTISGHGADIENLKRWQVSQNGSLRRIEDKVDKINKTLSDKLAGLEHYNDKRAIAILTSLVIACVLLVINLVVNVAQKIIT